MVKLWFKGAPLVNIKPNDTNLTYWYRGLPVPSVEKVSPAVFEASTLNLTLSLRDPSIPLPAVVEVDTQQLVLSLATVDVKVSISITSDLVSLNLDPLSPVIFSGVRINEALSLTLSQLTPQVSISITNFPPSLHLTFTIFEPSIAVNVSAHLETLHLTFTPLNVNVISGVIIKDTLTLIITPQEPQVFTQQLFSADVLHLTLQAHDIEGISRHPCIYCRDLLHKERSYAAHFTAANAEFADFSGSLLPTDFPLNPGYPYLTLCLWFRAKSFGSSPYLFRGIVNKRDCFTLGLIDSRPCLRLYYQRSGVIYHDDFKLLDSLSDPNIVAGRWYHLGITVDNENCEIAVVIWDDLEKRLILAQKYHPTSSHFPYQEISSDFTLGHDPSESNSYFDGYLDEVVIFNEIRSLAEIDAIRRGVYSGQRSGLAVSSSSLQIGWSPEYEIDVSSLAQSVGYSLGPDSKVSSFGVLVGYTVPELPSTPLPRLIGMFHRGPTVLRYRFKTDVFYCDYNSDEEVRFPCFTYPIEQLEGQLGSADQGSYLHEMNTLESGAEIFAAPIWPFREDIVHHARAGQTIVTVTDSTHFQVNSPVLLVRANDSSIFDLVNVVGITAGHLLLETALEHHYHPFQAPSSTQKYDAWSSFAVPCMVGIAEVSDHVLVGPRPYHSVNFKLDGGVSTTFQEGIPVTTFLAQPSSSAYIAPKMERIVVGSNVGILDLMAHLKTSRLAFSLEWSFVDSSWIQLRDLFFAVKGRNSAFYLPTWKFELQILSDASKGSTQVHLHSGFSAIFSRFRRLLVKSQKFVTVFLTEDLGDGYFACEPLEDSISRGDFACLFPQVRFMEDELVFEFFDKNQCTVKSSFIEVI